MKAIQTDGYGGPEMLICRDVDMPRPAQGQLLVRVEAAAVNPADGKWRSGMFAQAMPLHFPHIPGYDIAGRVETAAATGPAAGSRIAAMLPPRSHGGYAQYACVDASDAAIVPDGVDLARAAALPTAGLTALQMIEEQIDAQPGQLVLITGATGAVGRLAVHVAHQRGARVIAAVRHAYRKAALDLGVEGVVDLDGEDWHGVPFDHVADTVGGGRVALLCRHVREGGRIVTAATTPIPAEDLVAKPAFFAVRPDGPQLSRLLGDLARGAIDVPVAQILPLEEAGRAQSLVESGALGGKIILDPWAAR